MTCITPTRRVTVAVDSDATELVPARPDSRILVKFLQYSNYSANFCTRVGTYFTGLDPVHQVALAASGGNVALNLLGSEFLGPSETALLAALDETASPTVYVTVAYAYV